MNRLKPDKQKQVIAALVEGNSIRATVRMTGVAKNTIVKLLADIGKACSEYQDKVLRNLQCERIQCDEIWAFCYAKERNVPQDKKGKFGYGDVWTYVALCADSKLVPTWRIGRRDSKTTQEFMSDLAQRMTKRVQLTTDGNTAYIDAVEDAFGADIDYAMLRKLYGKSDEEKYFHRKYSPSKCIGTKKEWVNGDPDLKDTSTSYVERQNLTMRMNMRRFTRLTNAFSKKVENLGHAVALHFMYYNFCRIHQSLRVTPAMQAGVTDYVWEIEDITALLSRP